MKYQAEIVSRTIAAVLGGYLFASVFSSAFVPVLLHVFDCNLGDSILIAAMLSYCGYFAIIIISFCRFNHWKIWGGLLLSIISLLLVRYVLLSL